MEEMYTEAHKKIREAPTKEKKAPSMAKPTRKGNQAPRAFSADQRSQPTSVGGS